MEIREYIAPLLKWWWLILASTVLAGGTSYLIASRQPLLYSTTTTIAVGSAAIDNPNPSNNELNITQQLAAFYLDLARRSSVRNATRDALGLSALPEIYVSQLVNTNMIDIMVTDTIPERAQAVANELANQLILRSPTEQQDLQQRQAFINEQLNGYEAAITEAQNQIAEKQGALGSIVSATELRAAQNEIANLQSSLLSLQRDYASLLGSTQQGATNTIRVVEAAGLPVRPVNSNNLLSAITSAAIGFVLGASAAYLLEYLDDTVKTPRQVEKLVNLPTLTAIETMKAEKSSLITISQPRSPTSESFRVLRTGIQFSSVDSQNRVLLVTSSMPLDGKTTISANLAVIMAQAGYNVLLLDADLRRPRQHELFDLSNKRGLTTLLLDFHPEMSQEETRLIVEDSAQVTRIGGLQVLTSGPIPPNPSELLGSLKMKQALEAMLAHFDYIVVDSPPALSVTDAVVLSTQADATIVVVRANKTRRAQAQQSVARLREVRANLIGVVLNGMSVKDSAYGAAYYYHAESMAEAELDSAATNGSDSSLSRLRRRFLRDTTQESISDS